ncbi:carboxypeptidase-like regulatory domain-containing protein [Bacteroides xylanisolvens]|nr:carboxypeptidase-like regulatory domain-containing protein [Bacteroides xylanisolvens]
MRKILFLILMLSSVGIQAQNLIVKGVVSDESDVLPGVSIFVEGTSKGTISDINGKYSIEVKKREQTSFLLCRLSHRRADSKCSCTKCKNES